MIELMRVIRLIGDGHTQFAYWMGNYHRYPLELQLFGNEFRVVGIDAKHKMLLGSRLIAVDGFTVDKVQALLKPLLQGVENSFSERQRIASAIATAEILRGARITSNLYSATFTFERDDKIETSVALRSLKNQSFRRYAMTRMTKQAIPSFSKHQISLDGLELSFSANKQIAYLDFQTYPNFSRMRDFCAALTKLLRKENTRNAIIDLRNNGGGDFFVGLQLAWALVMVDNLDWKNGIYVLTGPKTFSAAMSNAVQYRQILNAKLVGEPTGANPVGYQDAGTFTLPNSCWTIMYSKRLYRFQETSTLGVQPDIQIDPEWDSFKNGRDKQVEWVINAIGSESDKGEASKASPLIM